jgi:1-acyl-sn-glycerol-3-phosphate acyltransferase
MELIWPLVNTVQGIVIALWTAFGILVALFASALARTRRPGLFLARRVWARPLLRMVFVRLGAVGAENLDPSRPCFFAANHQSWIDIPALFAALPVPVLFVAKRELGRVPFLGWFMKGMGMVLIDRDDRKDAVRSVEAAADRLRQGWNLLTFPEGTRAVDGKVQRFKTAAFAAAIAAGVPVVPVALEGTGRVLPRGSLKGRPGRVLVAIGEPIPTADLRREDRAVLARRAQQAVEVLLAGLRNEPVPAAAVHPVDAAADRDALLEA